MMKKVLLVIVTLLSVMIFGCAGNGRRAEGIASEVGREEVKETFTNSIGMQFVRIPRKGSCGEPGSFVMGQSRTPLPDELTRNLSYPKREDLVGGFPQGDPAKFAITVEHVRNGDFDEEPAHKVKITRPFYMGAFEVTNKQYEMFDPSHRGLRGKNGFSWADDEAVIFVSWNDARAFCEWLSKKEGRTYRLPTEAEWEYACRAGTTTHFWTGDSLPEAFHKNVRRTSFNEPKDIVPLTVGKTPANPWGLYDMHGNVEEWCNDWYGPYAGGEQTDPVGMAEGDFKVARGGSHGTNLYYLRSANRMGTLPENR
ncbi:MAG: formylglycine-generating enzyme family protein [Planctomycetota bacterium]|jgi:formylglycine-generating enzyme required for sulfatase activity